MYHGRSNLVLRFLVVFGLVISLPVIMTAIFFSVNYQSRAAAPTSMYQVSKYPVPSGIRLPTQLPPYIKAGDLNKPSGQAVYFGYGLAQAFAMEVKTPRDEFLINPNNVDFNLDFYVRLDSESGLSTSNSATSPDQVIVNPPSSPLFAVADGPSKEGPFAGYGIWHAGPNYRALVFKIVSRITEGPIDPTILELKSDEVLNLKHWNQVSIEVKGSQAIMNIKNEDGAWTYRKTFLPSRLKFNKGSSILFSSGHFEAMDNLQIMNKPAFRSKVNTGYWNFNCNLKSSNGGSPLLTSDINYLNLAWIPWYPPARYMDSTLPTNTSYDYKCP